MEIAEAEAASHKNEQVLHQRHLPDDLITQHILPKLPVKSLFKFKSVSKQWYSTLSSYQFANTHFKLSPSSHTQFIFIQNRNDFYLFSCNDDGDEIGDYCKKNLLKLGFDFNDEELVLIGSCNGLVCLASFSGYFFVLWNPLTGQFRKYSDPELLVDSSSSFRVSWGFGYVSVTDDYKVVRILELNGSLDIWVHVFSLKWNRWTRMSNEVCQDLISLRTNERQRLELDHGGESLFPYSFHSRQGVLVDETLYWIVSKENGWCRKIVAFNLVLEMFESFICMDLVSNGVYLDKFVFAMGGCLYKCRVDVRDDIRIDMLKGSGKVDSLRLSRDLRLRSCQGFVGFSRTGKFYILLEDSTIGIINPNSEPIKYTPVIHFESLGKSRVTSYVPSLILPYTVA
ncbi:hypothetical protein SOVF_207960 [Spinacia oleracea]|uniref:F-box/kelch-repeat protein At3g06240 n=1 Tax=Spinacia oleracea TaxID=3562 RepID=A0A9R0HQN4_SPIOL|nr:F-box/kelch-repeat protein At3g06240-like [Spinacia oleracea]KNA03560.1 hypothetical protein SOVF_207960 [Spinacia oleracea]